MNENGSFAFIVGSPRSGTTILGEVLDNHDQISQWYEPYFVWDRYFRNSADDERMAQDCTLKVKDQISRDFFRYKKKMRCKVVVDKSPRNSLKIPFIHKIFPEARFIHILRDGRDAALSIHKEWMKRRNIVHDGARGNRFNYHEAARVIKTWIGRQPFGKDKMRALWFETHGHFLDKSKHLNRLRWNGRVGWGPRFIGWDKVLQEFSLLQFNAYQWVKCVEHIQNHWFEIPEDKRLEIRYEAVITQPERTVKSILEFLNVRVYEGFFRSLPRMKKGNFDKWKNEFTSKQIEEIKPILDPLLNRLGYAEKAQW